jgi:mono/diheme cytochrome c family protein
MRTIGSLTAAVTVAAIALGATAKLGARQGGGQQQGAAARSNTPTGSVDTDEDGQPRTLPKLPAGMTTQMIVQGDSIFHGKAACYTCHGADATGMPASGSGITRGVAFIPNEWQPIDSLITAGISEDITRSPIAMPPKGAQSNLTPDEIKLVAAYVWAIAHVRGEPWPGGHRTHEQAGGQGTAASTPATTPAGAPAPKKP